MLRGRFFRRSLEPAMYKTLVVALLSACLVNIACVCSHLYARKGPIAAYANVAAYANGYPATPAPARM